MSVNEESSLVPFTAIQNKDHSSIGLIEESLAKHESQPDISPVKSYPPLQKPKASTVTTPSLLNFDHIGQENLHQSISLTIAAQHEAELCKEQLNQSRKEYKRVL